MALPETVYETSKDARQAARMEREARGLRKKAKRRGGFMTHEEQRDLARAERFLREHPVTLTEPVYEHSELA